MKKTRFTSLRTPSPSVHRSGQYLEQIKAPGHHALRRLPVRMIGRWKCWDGRSRFGEDRAWSHASIPVASAGLTDELFNQDAAVQFYTMLRREYTAAGPAPHGSLAVVVMTHASAGSSNSHFEEERLFKRMYREGWTFTSDSCSERFTVGIVATAPN